MSRRIVLTAAAAGVLVGGGALTYASWPDDHPAGPATTAAHLVTEAEADRLAIARFQNSRRGGTEFRTKVAARGQTISLDGAVDYRRHVGYALVAGAGAAYLLQWNAATLLAWPVTAGTTNRPAGLPSAAPARRPLDPRATATDAVLAFVLQLGQDRPDNAQLIRQGGARWLRSAQVGGRRVEVIRGPRGTGASRNAAIDYWLAGDSTLVRVEVHLAGASQPTRIELDPTAFEPFPVAAALRR